MLHAWFCSAGQDRWNPVGPAPEVTRSCCRGSKATRVTFRVYFKGDQKVVADRAPLRRSHQLEGLEPKE
eukprot:618494-Alexandrium_andersonii.AAC.1